MFGQLDMASRRRSFVEVDGIVKIEMQDSQLCETTERSCLVTVKELLSNLTFRRLHNPNVDFFMACFTL
jgi:hypothetical protein